MSQKSRKNNAIAINFQKFLETFKYFPPKDTFTLTFPEPSSKIPEIFAGNLNYKIY